jgi:hypothetical protein
MITFNVTIDGESNSDLFLRMMEELKFVVSVVPDETGNGLDPVDFALPGRPGTDEEFERLMVISEESETYSAQKSKKINKQKLGKWSGSNE